MTAVEPAVQVENKKKEFQQDPQQTIDKNFVHDTIYLYLGYGYKPYSPSNYFLTNLMTKNKEKILINFKKAQSLLSKIIVMKESDKYCIDIMQQNLAAIGLLKSAHQMLLEGHLKSCFKNAMQAKNEKRKQEMIDEILKVTKLASK